MITTETTIPDLKLVKSFLPKGLHDNFLKQMNAGIPEQNDGHYDGFDFPNYEEFDSAYLPLIKYALENFRELGLFIDKPFLGCSIVGYKARGYIKRHTDNVALSGDTVAVMSFGSPIVVNFYSEDGSKQHEKVFIEPQDLYIMAGRSRHQWSHAILPNEDKFKGKKFKRGKRYSMLLFEPGPAFSGEIIPNQPEQLAAIAN